MITLLSFTPHFGADTFNVYLDLSSADAKTLGCASDAIFCHAKASKRKVGAVVRQYGGNTLFTYDPKDQGLLEVQLLASLAKNATQVHVNTDNGENATWNI